MTKLLVNTPHGTQEILEIGQGGGYFDNDLILWDERIDGPLPEITLGGMVRTENILVLDDDMLKATENKNKAEQAEHVRQKRDGLLAETDWVVTKALEAEEAVPEGWVTYRQALRDITAHENFPDLAEDDWPTKP